MSNLCEGAGIDGSVVGHVRSGSKNQRLSYSDTVCSVAVIILLCIV